MYDIILADPCWSYRNKASQGAADNHYETLSTKDLCALPIQNIAAENSLLFLWATLPMIEEALATMKSWEFIYKTVAFTWIKLNKDGKTPFFGIGNYTASNAEIVLLGKRGNGLSRVNKDVSQIIMAKRMRHSQKPVEVIQRIDRLYGNCKKIELFARSKQPGWDATGFDLDGIDIRDFLDPERLCIGRKEGD
jgi:N6-adenosine-specific RNA methylase IME4